jgi:hypothetical protein
MRRDVQQQHEIRAEPGPFDAAQRRRAAPDDDIAGEDGANCRGGHAPAPGRLVRPSRAHPRPFGQWLGDSLPGQTGEDIVEFGTLACPV